MKKYLLVSSSSGGHVFPCINLGNFLLKENQKVEFLGIKGQFEEKYYPHGIYLSIPSSFNKFLKTKDKKNIKKEFIFLKNKLKEYDVIICFGGFITLFVSLANIYAKKKLYLHEQNVIIGDSNLLSYPFCKKMFVSFNKKYFLKKTIYSSTPIIDKIKHRSDINLKNPKILFVFGSLSSYSCLKIVHDFIKETNLKNEFLIVCGKYQDLFLDIKKENVIIKEKINMKEVLNYYDLVFSRSGGSTLFELLYSGVEICLIPSPNVKRNHQEKNAKFYKKYVRIIKEKDFSKEYIEKIIISLKRKNEFIDHIDPLKIIYNEVKND